MLVVVSGTMFTQLHILSISFLCIPHLKEEAMYLIPQGSTLRQLAPAVQKVDTAIHQVLVVQTLGSTIYWINPCPADKH